MIPGIVSSFRRGSTPPGDGHLHWRLLIEQIYRYNNANVVELVMRSTPGGPQICVGGIATANSNLGASFSPEKAFDGLPNTGWLSRTADPAWLAYQLPAPAQVVEFSITADFGSLTAGDGNPKLFRLEYSDDGVEWFDASGNYPSQPVWAESEVRTFSVPA